MDGTDGSCYLVTEYVDGSDLSVLMTLHPEGVLLSGKRPFEGGSVVSKLKRHSTAPRPSCVSDTIPIELDNIVRKMMDCDPSKRYQQPKDVANALSRFRSSTTLTSVRRSIPRFYKYIALAAFPLIFFAGWIITVATKGLRYHRVV